ncbi:MAG: 5'/3'-nucleotidase SurE [bacterium]|nr:5'/3'-nucleotidase SurE [bacterium]
MRILLTNDDSIHAAGIHALWKEAVKYGEVFVVAPAREMSAIGHAITISDSLRIEPYDREGMKGWAVTGTPADCVKMALKEIMPEKPDVVISGVNQGSNTGLNVIYSGTVSGASEASICGCSALAVSLDSYTSKDFSVAAQFALRVAQHIAANPLPIYTLLNVNVPPLPASQIKGVKTARQGRMRYDEVFDRREDPRGRVYYWMGAERLLIEEPDDVDETIVANGYISVTPLQLDLTDYKVLPEIEKWHLTMDGIR